MVKIKNLHIFNIEMWMIYMVGQRYKKLPVNTFEWIKDTSQFNEDFIKNYNEESDKEHFLKVDVEKLNKLHNNLPFYQKECKLKSRKACN